MNRTKAQPRFQVFSTPGRTIGPDNKGWTGRLDPNPGPARRVLKPAPVTPLDVEGVTKDSVPIIIEFKSGREQHLFSDGSFRNVHPRRRIGDLSGRQLRNALKSFRRHRKAELVGMVDAVAVSEAIA
jgi:hypothetical protein